MGVARFKAAGRAGGAKEMLRLLRRAFDLWPGVRSAEPSRLDLLQRIRLAADQAGAQEDELTAVEDLLGLVDRQRDPLTAAELLVRRMILRWSTGREFAPMADVREAVRLSAGAPDSWQYALALAELADAELWHKVPSGPARAEEAARAARVSLALPATHRLAKFASVIVPDLAEETILMLPKALSPKVWDTMHHHLLPHGTSRPQQIITESHNTGPVSVMRGVAAGKGVAPALAPVAEHAGHEG
jgi:hypothetical protein